MDAAPGSSTGAEEPQSLGLAGTEEPARRTGGRHRDRQGRRPRGGHEPGPRDHGPQRVRQVDARLRDRRPPRLRDHGGADPARRRRRDRGRRRRARAEGPLPRIPVPACDPRRHGDELLAPGDQRRAQGAQRRRRVARPRAGVPQVAAGRDGPPQGQPRARLALPQRRVLRRREEAGRDPSDGDAEAADRGPRRDGLRTRHRRPPRRRERRPGARRPRHGRARDHALPADPRPHHARLRARLRRRQDRRGGRPGARAQARGPGLRLVHSGDGGRGGVMAQTESEIVQGIGSDYEVKYGFHVPEDYFFKSGRGLSHELVDAISSHKGEPDWMRKFRHRSLEYFLARPLPTWGGNVAEIDFENIYYYIRPTEKQADKWEDLPADIKDTWDKLGIPEAEKKYLAGVGAQYESEVVYHKLQEHLTAQGVIFLDMDSGLREHEDIVRKYFGKIIPPNDNKFAALNSAVWSGGSFIYVPPGVKIEMPLQAYFRINAENMGQFERTLILVDEGAYVHYVEGCTAPIYSSDSLHSAVVEIVVKKGGRCRYTTIQNWSNNVYNLVTKRAVAYEDATMEWVDGNLGSKLTMKYPAIWLTGERAHGEVLSIAFAGKGQHQDAGGKCVHMAPKTTSVITSKSISKDGGRAGYRGLLEVSKNAAGSKSKVVCDALILDERSRSDTYPYIRIDESNVDIGHEATVSKIGEEQLFYLMSRGLSEAEASAMVVSGFVEPITKELPLEYAVEMNRLIQLQMEGSVG